MSQRFLRAFATISVAAAVMTGCSILPKSEPLAVYRLPEMQSATVASSTTQASLRSLRIGTPYANRTLDSERILVVPEGDLVKSYAGARWSAPTPVLVRDRLLQAFGADGRFAGLSGDNANIAADLELNGSLVSYQTEYRNGVPTVVVEFDAYVIETATRRQIAAKRFNVARPADGAKVPEVINAFGVATNTLATQLVGWVGSLPQARAQTSPR